MKAELQTETPLVKNLVRFMYIVLCKPPLIANVIKYAKPFKYTIDWINLGLSTKVTLHVKKDSKNALQSYFVLTVYIMDVNNASRKILF